ncbi:MAG TPA: GxxExxY protein [Bacteroidia bacterium]|nr:GxxExxY protein [Bacteroidia bacterium]
MTEHEMNNLSRKIIGCCIEVHKILGAGHPEEFYQRSLLRELALQGISAQTQVEVPVVYKGTTLEHPFFIDMLIEDTIIVNVKAVDQMNPLFDAQLLSHLRVANKQLGLVVNFNTPRVVDGIKRVVNNL